MNLSTQLNYSALKAEWIATGFTTGNRHLKRLSTFFATLCCLMFCFSSQAQLNCGSLNCTANDVQIVKAYFTGADGKAISCDNGDIVDGYLHVVLSTNTPRKGVSVSGTLVIDGTSNTIGACFNNDLAGSNNDLVFSTPFKIKCSSTAYLAGSLVSWGTGNDQYCTGTSAQCPATKSKCRYTASEIPINIKLQVFFGWLSGDCTKGEYGLTVKFTSNISLENVTVDSYSWDFGDRSSIRTETNPLYTYAEAGTYNVTLTVTGTKNDGSGTIEKSITLPVTVAACCNLAAPTVGPFTYCTAENKTFGDLPQDDGNGGYYNWFDENDNGLVLTDKIPAGTHTYYVSLAKGNCESPKIGVTVTVDPTPTASISYSGSPYCAMGKASVTQTGTSGGTYTSTSGLVIDANSGEIDLANSIANTYTITYSFSNGTCTNTTTTTVTINALPIVNAITGSDNVCSGKTITLGSTTLNGIWSSSSPTVASVNSSGVVTAYTVTTSTPVTITYTVTDANTCSNFVTKVITVNPLPICSITQIVPGNPKIGQQATFTAGAAATYSWSIDGTPGSNTANASIVGSNNLSSVQVVATTMGKYRLLLSITNASGCASTCNNPVNVDPIGPSITYTQGFYGNSGGKTCDTKYSYQVMNAAVNATAEKAIRFGNQADSRSFTLKLSDVASSSSAYIFKMLPGGTTPAVLKYANSYVSTATTASYDNPKTYPAVPMSPSINNVLLAQTMALRFNIFYSKSVSKPIEGLVLTGNVLTFVKPTTSCGSTYPTTGGTTQTIPCSVFINLQAMNGGATIGNLLILANKVLGGEAIPVPTTTISASEMNNAVDIINKGFDGGGQIIKVSSTPCATAPAITLSASASVTEAVAINAKLSVSAFPNPYTDKVKFVIQSPISGQATLDVFNMLGQKIKTVFQGNVVAGIGQAVEYNVPKVNASNLIYTLRVGNNKVTGKLMH